MEKPAEPRGGLDGLYQVLQKNITYPVDARRKGIMGKVFVSFIIERDGTLADVRVVKGIGYGCDEEAVRVIKITSPWKPAMQNGKPVRSRFVIPLEFKLKR
ncbi:MAG TPA: energy transducer TonB [Chryseolinea sp.]|nr:energy transducer TonB [Chryseolinea sp.]